MPITGFAALRGAVLPLQAYLGLARPRLPAPLPAAAGVPRPGRLHVLGPSSHTLGERRGGVLARCGHATEASALVKVGAA